MISPLVFEEAQVYDVVTKNLRVADRLLYFSEPQVHVRIFLKSGTANVIKRMEFSEEVGVINFRDNWLVLKNHIIWKNINGIRQIVQVSEKRFICYLANIHLFCKPLSNLNDMLDFLDM